MCDLFVIDHFLWFVPSDVWLFCDWSLCDLYHLMCGSFVIDHFLWFVPSDATHLQSIGTIWWLVCDRSLSVNYTIWCDSSAINHFIDLYHLMWLISFCELYHLHDWCTKGRGMCYPVCGMVHIKEPLLLIGKSSPCGGSRFPLSLSEWSFTICLTPYICK